MMNISDTTHLTNILRKITLAAGILAVAIFSSTFILKNLDSNAEELIPISAPIQSRTTINTSDPLPLNIPVIELLSGFDPDTMEIIIDDSKIGMGITEKSVDVIVRHGVSRTEIKTKEGYIWEDGNQIQVYEWNAIPNQSVPRFITENIFEYDGNEHCIELMYDDKFIVLSNIDKAPNTPEETIAQKPTYCATEPGKYYIYAFVFGEMAWMDGSKGSKELIWEIIDEKTPTEPAPEEPTPEEPTPEEPTPTESTPEEPTPEEPTPEEPTPTESTPEEPTPEEPTPTEPTPEEQKGQEDEIPENPTPTDSVPEEPKEEIVDPGTGKGGSAEEKEPTKNIQVPNTGIAIDEKSIITETIFIIVLAAATTYLIIKTARKDSK